MAMCAAHGRPIAADATNGNPHGTWFKVWESGALCHSLSFNLRMCVLRPEPVLTSQVVVFYVPSLS